MIDTGLHIIHKLSLDIDTNSEQLAHKLKGEMSDFVNNELQEYLEELFVEFTNDAPEQVIRIDQLTIPLDCTVDKFKNELKEAVRKEIKNCIGSPVYQGSQIQKQSPKESTIAAFWEVIEEGRLPWWKSSEEGISFTDAQWLASVSDPIFQATFLRKIEKEGFRKQLIQQCLSAELFVLAKALPKAATYFNTLSAVTENQIQKLKGVNKAVFWALFFESYQEEGLQYFVADLLYLVTALKIETSLQQPLFANALQHVEDCLKASVMQDDLENRLQQVFFLQPNEAAFDIQKLSKLNTKASKWLVDFQKNLIQKSITAVSKNIILLEEVKNEAKKGGQDASEPSESSKTSFQEEENTTISDVKDHQSISTPEKRALQNKKEGSANTIEEAKQGGRIDSNKQEQKDKLSTSEDIEDTTKKVLESTFDINATSPSLKNTEAEEILEEEKASAVNTSKEISAKQPITHEVNEKKEDRIGGESSEDQSLEKETNESISKTANTSKDNMKSNAKAYEIKRRYEAYKKQFEEGFQPVDDQIITLPFNQESEQALVPNAGLILIHPFIKIFFTNCGFYDPKKKEITEKVKAVHALHYIATKEEQDWNANLVFEKFLCGVPLNTSIPREIELGDEVKEQAEDLLQATLDNWDVLSHASVDLLRHEYLQRSGKIDITSNTPRITIEKKTQDILLDKISWNLSIAKLPWIDSLIYTDW